MPDVILVLLEIYPGLIYGCFEGETFQDQPDSEIKCEDVASAVASLQRGFDEARSRIPAIFFLDEIDSLGISRNNFTVKFENYLFRDIF